MRIAVPVGIAAAVVQVIGLLRWPILVPGYADATDDARTRSRPRATSSAPRIGETVGYLLTATWTALVIVALGRRFAGRWFQLLGGAAAVLVLAGVFSPLGAAGDRHRELLRLRALERVAGRVRRRDPGPRAPRRRVRRR